MIYSGDYSLASYDFDLPEHLIAQSRVHSTEERLMQVAHDGTIQDLKFLEWVKSLDDSVALVLNDTKVVKARLHLDNVICIDTYGVSHLLTSGEIFVYEIIDERHAEVLVSDGKHFRPGWTIVLQANSTSPISISSLSFEKDGILMAVPDGFSWWNILKSYGSMPLPPYISGEGSEAAFEKDYQTDFAFHEGSVAAPTAGLRFGKEVLSLLDAQGVSYDFVTLHVGLGTFKPLSSDDIRDNELHREHVCVHQSFLENLRQWKSSGKKIIGVGTTSCRVIESLPYVLSSDICRRHHGIASFSGSLLPCKEDTHNRMTGIGIEESADGFLLRFHTQLFIYPGFTISLLDGLLTNFHLPKTSLLVLVASFLGSREALLRSYDHAIAHLYRFYSFGDGMLIWKERNS